MAFSTRCRFLLAAAAAAGLIAPASGAVVVTTDSQTGPGPFTPSYMVSSTDLINGKSPAASAGNFALESSGGTPVLTNGTFGTISGGNPGTNTLFATAGGGSGSGTSVVYSLATPADLSSVVVYGGWNDSGRDQQKYSVSYSNIGAPAVILPLATVDFNPAAGGNPSATRVTITDNAGGFIATGVTTLIFTFDSTVENGYAGYTEIDVFGQPVPEPASLGSLGLAVALGRLARRRRRA